MKYLVWRLATALGRVILGPRNVILQRGVRLNHRTVFEGNNKIYSHAQVLDSHIGFGTYVGDRSILNNCWIGKYCSISQDCEVVIGRHPTRGFVSTHPAFFSKRRQAGFTYAQEQLFLENKLTSSRFSASIGNDVWLGSGVVVLEGVSIGDGSIVGARSVVTSDVAPYSIVVGNPATVIRYRFDDGQIAKLLEIKWWNRSSQWIRENSRAFGDIETFLSAVES